MRYINFVILLLVSTAYADIKDYEHPLICKPITVMDGVTVISDESEWIILPWKDFVSLGKDKLLFKHLDKLVVVPMKGYICEQ